MSNIPRRAILGAFGATAAGVSGCQGLLSRFDTTPTGSPISIDPESYPPGTDSSGFSDPDTLLIAHRNALANNSFQYRDRYTSGSVEPSYETSGRQVSGGETAARSATVEERLVIDGDRTSYTVDGTRRVHSWRGPEMQQDGELRRIHTDVEVEDPEEYKRVSPYAEEFPPGERTVFRHAQDNDTSLMREHRDFIVASVLPVARIVPVERVSFDGTEGIRFRIDGSRVDPDFSGTATGQVSIETSGIIRSLSMQIQTEGSDEPFALEVAFDGIGDTALGERPSWVSGQFETEASSD